LDGRIGVWIKRACDRAADMFFQDKTMIPANGDRLVLNCIGESRVISLKDTHSKLLISVKSDANHELGGRQP
jgi:hypothetical protein